MDGQDSVLGGFTQAPVGLVEFQVWPRFSVCFLLHKTRVLFSFVASYRLQLLVQASDLSYRHLHRELILSLDLLLYSNP